METPSRTTRPMSTTSRSLSKPAIFADIGYVPHEGQLEVHRSTASRRVLACGVRWGKTLCAAMEAIAGTLAPCVHGIGWVVAPTYDLADKVFREVLLIATEKLRHRVVAIRESERRVIMRNLGGGVSEVRAKSADNPTSLLGEGLDWLVVDEAARLHPRIWQGHLSQRLLDKRGWALLISTPTGKGWFYDAYRRGQSGDPEWASWNMPSWSNPYLDRERIKAERALLPERVFRQEYGGEFIEGSGAVFRNVRECATGAWIEPSAARFCTAGLDLARIEDFTVLTVLDGQRRVAAFDRFHRIGWADQVSRIHRGLARYRQPRTMVDATGIGDPVYEQLRRAGCNVHPFKLTAQSKRALIDSLAMQLEQGLITLPRPELAPELIDELESFEYSVSDSGHVRSGAPAGQHDDAVISLALAAWSQRPVPRRFAIHVIRRPRKFGMGYDYFRSKRPIPLGPSLGARNMP